MFSQKSLKDTLFGDLSFPVSDYLFGQLQEINRILLGYEEYLKEQIETENVRKKLAKVKELYNFEKATNYNVKEFKILFSLSEQTLSAHRCIPIGKSVGGEVVDEINEIFSNCFVEEWIVKDLLKLVTDYKNHLQKQIHDSTDALLNEKITLIVQLEACLTADKKPNTKLEDFDKIWKTDCPQKLTTHRTHSAILRFFIAHNMHHSEGEKFVANVNAVLQKLQSKQILRERNMI